MHNNNWKEFLAEKVHNDMFSQEMISTNLQLRQGLSESIIAMTANAMKGDREKYIGADMDDYIGKSTKQDIMFRILSE